MKTMMLYPAYIDAGKSRHEGRKVPQGIALPNPTAEEMLQACKNLGMNPKGEEKQFPSEQGEEQKRAGRIVVEKKFPKIKVLRMICDGIRASRQSRKTSE